uniref:Uncharacterized protein n=1 Tax=Setaria italica TaxID=4555 RepID=K3YUU1_SETIT
MLRASVLRGCSSNESGRWRGRRTPKRTEEEKRRKRGERAGQLQTAARHGLPPPELGPAAVDFAPNHVSLGPQAHIPFVHNAPDASRAFHTLPSGPHKTHRQEAAESANPSTSRHLPGFPAQRSGDPASPGATPPLSTAAPPAIVMSTQSISPASASAQFTYHAAAAAAATTPSYFPVPFHLQNPQYAAWHAATAAAPAYNAVYPMPQVQQAQHLFQKDSKIISPEALATVKAAIANSEKDKKVEAAKKAVPRKAAGQSWEDPTLADWPESKISNSLLS